jgi:benzaldehyde dehydrogenase (NAD)
VRLGHSNGYGQAARLAQQPETSGNTQYLIERVRVAGAATPEPQVQWRREQMADAQLLARDIWQGKIFDGHWRESAGDHANVIEKATGERLGQVGLAAPDDVARSSRAAAQAQREWFAMPLDARAAVFRKAISVIEQNKDELAEWIMRETGSIRPKADLELHMAEGILAESAALITQPPGLLLPSNPGRISLGRRLPHGVVGVISPFNFPLILAIRAVSPALALGNAVVLKPDPQTAVAGGVLLARVFEEAGLPAGLLHLLPGGPDVGQAMCTDPVISMIAFTGSTQAGRRVGALASEHLKKVSLELGGKNSLIVLEDADLDVAASNAAFGSWMHQGQICMTTGRILVHENIAEQLVAKLVEKANHIPVGDPMSGKVALGPLINQRQLERVHGIVEDTVAQGATLAAGGTYEKLFYKPTVLNNVKPGMRAFDEEVFGPVTSVTTFATEDEAVELANQNEYGLSAAVISRNVSHALALGNRLNVGLLHINDQTVADEPYIPFGGRGNSGNGEAVGGPANWEAFTQWQWVTIKDQPPQYPF